eukprot:scaffold127862_cov75-Phaeocystis_antarctica.AAC.2
MISSKLRQQRLRWLPQLIAGAAHGHGEARLEHVAQLGEEDALLVAAQRHERHRAAAPHARRARWGVTQRAQNTHDFYKRTCPLWIR